jgi:hypothetical protein
MKAQRLAGVDGIRGLAALFAPGARTAGIVGASAARRSWPWAWLALAAAEPVFATILVQGSVWTLDARAFASVFEFPFQRGRGWSWPARLPQARAEGVPV